MKYSAIPNLIIGIGFICAELLLLSGGEEQMNTAGWISIFVALIAVAGGIWGQIVQFKKDAQRIDGVNATAGEVKSDTSGMKPKIDRIEELSKQMSSDIVREILPQISNVGKIGEDVGKLLEGYKVEKEIKNRVSTSLNNPDYLISSIKLLYDINASCNGQIQELTNEVYNLRNENAVLKEEVFQLKEERTKLKQENFDLRQTMNQSMDRNIGARER